MKNRQITALPASYEEHNDFSNLARSFQDIYVQTYRFQYKDRY